MDSTRNSQTSAATSITHSPGYPPKLGAPPMGMLVPPISDLELRIDCDRAVDLFTMQPRVSQLQITSLTFRNASFT